jgi:hypothetical protein
VSSYSYTTGGGAGGLPSKLSNIFPMNNKLATAIAWHEESIREENEYAENDEINQSIGQQHVMTGQKSSESLMRERRKGHGGIGVRNNKMRTSQENPMSVYNIK